MVSKELSVVLIFYLQTFMIDHPWTSHSSRLALKTDRKYEYTHIEIDRQTGWQIQNCPYTASIYSTGADQTPDSHQTPLQNVIKCLFLHFYKDLVQAVGKWNMSDTLKGVIVSFFCWISHYGKDSIIGREHSTEEVPCCSSPPPQWRILMREAAGGSSATEFSKPVLSS